MLLLDNNLHEKRHDRKSRWTKFFVRNKETLCHFCKFFLFLKYLVRVSMKTGLHVRGSQ